MQFKGLKSEIAQPQLSDLGRVVTPQRKTSFFPIRFSTDREPVGPRNFTLCGEGGCPLSST